MNRTYVELKKIRKKHSSNENIRFFKSLNENTNESLFFHLDFACPLSSTFKWNLPQNLASASSFVVPVNKSKRTVSLSMFFFLSEEIFDINKIEFMYTFYSHLWINFTRTHVSHIHSELRFSIRNITIET